jgi:putative flavoprotein involved in K+ transport
VEAAPELGHTWRSRWDSLKLFTPAQYDALPGMAFPAPADTYPTKDPVADYLQAYAAAFDLPVRLDAKVTELRRLDDGRFEVRTAAASYRAGQVVVATGPFQVPFVPSPAAKLDASVTQVHSADYRNPQALPDGPVLVVGAGTRASRSPRSWPPPAPSTCRSPPSTRCCPSGGPAGTCSGG